jgi:hypothetical protein
VIYAEKELKGRSGYVVRLVNTTDESQVFATSEAFEIQDGECESRRPAVPAAV